MKDFVEELERIDGLMPDYNGYAVFFSCDEWNVSCILLWSTFNESRKRNRLDLCSYDEMLLSAEQKTSILTTEPGEQHRQRTDDSSNIGAG